MSRLVLTLALAGLALCQSHGREFGNVPAECFRVPDNINTSGNTLNAFPDPFKFLNGSTTRTKADWACRKEQLRALFQKYEQGDKPPKPKVLTGTWSGNSLVVTAGDGSKNITFTVPIKKPAGQGPFPAIMTMGGMASIPVPANVATINLPVEAIANNGQRAVGAFYNLYGKSASASTLLAWAWAASRVIDLLETMDTVGIDAKRIGVTGCSRYGKGALIVGAFDDRIALTIPQESGCGGDSCWRTAQVLRNRGEEVETASNLAGTSWTSTRFQPWSSAGRIGSFPLDHHELAGIIAPRGLYSTSNTNYNWLGKSSPFICMTAANKIYAALGVKSNHGFSNIGGHSHCQFPAAQGPELTAFIQKFLFGNGQANTNVFTNKAGYKADASWTPWEAPHLA